MKIGFLGWGNMGNPMAGNLQASGFPLSVFDLNQSAAAELIAGGAGWAESPRNLAAGADVVITSLPGPPQVEAALLGEDGVLAGLEANAIWIDMFTNERQLVARLADLAAERGAHVLDAPVTGAVDGARDGRLTIYVGGDEEVFARSKPVFIPLGRAIYVGALGAGNVTKLITNLLWFINAVSIGEGLLLGKRAGIDLETLWDAIKSSVGNSFVVEHDVPSIFRGDYDPSFTLDLCCKDMALLNTLGRELGVPLQMGALAEQTFQRARVQYSGGQGEMHVVKLLEDAVGVDLRVADH